MATITRTNETAKKAALDNQLLQLAYEHAHAEAMELTSRITGLLNRHPPGAFVDWGHVSDLERINATHGARYFEILAEFLGDVVVPETGQVKDTPVS